MRHFCASEGPQFCEFWVSVVVMCNMRALVNFYSFALHLCKIEAWVQYHLVQCGMKRHPLTYMHSIVHLYAFCFIKWHVSTKLSGLEFFPCLLPYVPYWAFHTAIIQIIHKFRTCWEIHKIWKNLPYGFDKSADLLSKSQNHE